MTDLGYTAASEAALLGRADHLRTNQQERRERRACLLQRKVISFWPLGICHQAEVVASWREVRGQDAGPGQGEKPCGECSSSFTTRLFATPMLCTKAWCFGKPRELQRDAAGAASGGKAGYVLAIRSRRQGRVTPSKTRSSTAQ